MLKITPQDIIDALDSGMTEDQIAQTFADRFNDALRAREQQQRQSNFDEQLSNLVHLFNDTVAKFCELHGIKISSDYICTDEEMLTIIETMCTISTVAQRLGKESTCDLKASHNDDNNEDDEDDAADNFMRALQDFYDKLLEQ